MVGTTGVIDLLIFKLAELASLYKIVKTNISNIRPAIVDYYNSVSPDSKI
jgi:hypothetical protein